MWWIILGGGIAALLAASFAPRSPARARPSRLIEPEEDPLDLLARDAPQALLRYATSETAAWLEEQGRGDELRGLGYRE
jgi:hypothetical protein